MDSAREKCPGLHFAHVELIEAENAVGSTRDHSKVSLSRYRQASQQIFQILQKRCSVLQKASIDEAYCDLTLEVDHILKQKQAANPSLTPAQLVADQCWNGNVLPLLSDSEEPPSPPQPQTIQDVKLLIGAQVVHEIRTEVFTTLGYTCSAGIAHSKAFAKITASFNKPNGQTIVRAGAVEKLLQEITLRDIPSLGPKLTQQLQDMEISTPIELQQLEKEVLIEKFGEKTADWLYQICRGVDTAPVESRVVVKSIMAAKHFSAVRTMAELEPMIELLCIDLIDRMQSDQEQYQRIPQTLSIQYKMMTSKARALSSPMPPQRTNKSKMIVHIMQILSTRLQPQELFPCIRLALQASHFQSIKGFSSISSFFKQRPTDSSSEGSAPLLPQKRGQVKLSQTFVCTDSNTPASSKPSSSFSGYPQPKLNPSQLWAMEEETTELYKCAQCARLIQESHRTEHEDWHVAMELSAQVNQVPSVPPKSENSSQPKKKRQRGKAAQRDPKQKPIFHFLVSGNRPAS